MNNEVITYKNVFERTFQKTFTFGTFIHNPEDIFIAYERFDYEDQLERIKNIKNKEERNDEKRAFIPAVDISPSSILSIDIDGIFNQPELKQRVINRLKSNEYCYCIKESVSGNVVAFFKYNCNVGDYKFLYYKLYLQLVLELGVNIDFLPEIGRLRYVSIGETYHFNEDSKIVTDMLVVDEIPYINVTPKKARTVIFGSR